MMVLAQIWTVSAFGFALISPRPLSRPLLVAGTNRCYAAHCQEQPLPEGWQAETDDSTGKVYYVDTINRLSQWEVPTAPAQVIASTSVPGAPDGSGDGSLLWGMIAAEQNPYVKSKTERMKNKFE